VLADLSKEQGGSSPLLASAGASASAGVGGYLKKIKASLGSSSSLPALMPPSASAPAATAGGPSARDRLFEAFKNADADASGNISKRELYQVLEAAKLGDGAHEDFLRLFNGFDTNKDGRLSFEEFSRLANAMQ